MARQSLIASHFTSDTLPTVIGKKSGTRCYNLTVSLATSLSNVSSENETSAVDWWEVRGLS